jgi:hypothetical protein
MGRQNCADTSAYRFGIHGMQSDHAPPKRRNRNFIRCNDPGRPAVFFKLPTKIEFCKNLLIDGHLTLPNGVNKYITAISTFIDRFW